MAGLWVWSVLVGLFALVTVGERLYEFVVERNALALGFIPIWLPLWGFAAVRAVKRQDDLRPRWFWIAVGALGGILVLVPMWHHGREFKSRWDKVISWLAVLAVLVWLVLQEVLKP